MVCFLFVIRWNKKIWHENTDEAVDDYKCYRDSRQKFIHLKRIPRNELIHEDE